MKGKRTYPIRRVLAFILALLLAVNMVPGSVLVSAAADTVTFSLKGAALTNKEDGINILLEDADKKAITTSQTTVDITGKKAPFTYTITSQRYDGRVTGEIDADAVSSGKPIEVDFDTACTPRTAVISGYVADEKGNIITQPEIQAFYDSESGDPIADDQISIAEDGKYSITAYVKRTVAIKVQDKAQSYAGKVKTVDLAESSMNIENIVVSRTHYTVKAVISGDGSAKYQDADIPASGIIVARDADASVEIASGAGMKISELRVNGVKVDEASNETEYTLQLTGIDEDKEINVFFANPTKMSASIDKASETVVWVNTDVTVTGEIDFGDLGSEVSGLKIALSRDQLVDAGEVEVKDNKASINLTAKDEMENGALTVYAQYNIQGKTLEMTCVTSNTIGIDKTKPDAPAIGDDRDKEGADSTWAKDKDNDFWTKSGAEISYTAEDAGNVKSGVKEYAYNYTYGKDGSAEGTVLKEGEQPAIAKMDIDAEIEEAVTIKAKAVDQAGNESDETEHTVNVDTKGPAIQTNAEGGTGLIKNGDSYFTGKKGFTLPVQITDAGVGCEEYSYEVTNEASGAVITGTAQPVTDPVTVDAETLEEGSYTLTITAADRLGNVSREGFAFKVDKTAPTISLEFSQSVTDKILHILSFGLYSNDKIDVKMTITDTGAGIDENAVKSAIIKDFSGNLDVEAENMSDVDPDSGEVTFEIPMPVKGFLNVKIQDRLGNEENYTASKENSNIKNSDLITLENTEPGLEMGPDRNSDMFQPMDGRWYNSDVKYYFKASDDSGIFSIDIKVNGKALGEENITYTGKAPVFGKEKKSTKPVNTAKGSFEVQAGAENCDDSGACVVEVEVTDNAGNVRTETDTIYFDTKAPQILNFHFSPAGNETKDHAPVSIDKYGFFFKEDTTVTVDIADYCKEKSQSPGAGIHQVELKAVDGNGQVAASKTYAPEALINQGSYPLNVPADFKGQIIVTVDDNVATGEQAEAHTTSGSPYKTVIEGKDQTSASVTLPGTSYTDNAGLPLYNYDPTAKVRVKNAFAGLQAVNYARSESYGMQFAMDISQDVDGQVTNTFPSYEQDLNIYTSLAYDDQIVPSAPEVNGIELDLNGQCMAGHGFRVDTQKISIDKKAPDITVTWDNNDVRNEKYYKADRTATIRVEERNFDESKCEFIMTGPKPSVSGWSHNGDTHTATVTFSADGDYTFTFRTTDRAGHTSAYDRTDEFTIDKTAPVISVSYNNNDARNGYYYKEARTASLTITEHNFRASEVSTVMSANDNGAAISAPAVNGWSSGGDINTATIGYSYDGEFTFSMTYEDLAGNPAAPYGEDHFVVDLTDPELEIYDIVDKSANNDVVAPGVRYSDTNVDSEGVSISLKGANTGDRSMDGNKSVSANGVDLKLNDFPREKEVDDLYTMKAHVEDLSGRIAEQEIMFSVNRFGSVYVLDDATRKLTEKNDGYANKEQKVGIREINVDLLEAKDVSVSRDGDMSKLKEDKDYSVKMSGDEASWKEYYYQLDKENFEEEGTYNVTIFSTDRANNSQDNKNNKRNEECNVEFVIDKTAPTTAISGIENTGRYREPERNVQVDAKDNILLDKIVAEVDGEVLEYDASKIAKGNGTVEFTVKSADKWQNVKVYSVDKAGNTDKKEMNSMRVIVTSSLWVQFTHNTPVLVGTILAIVAIAVAAVWFFVIRKKEEEDQTA